ncbi:hypothetical protein BCA33_16755 [Marinobacter sp. AC-23]|nr:hypothetical protein BCA33_16755 [Marinobacter sp. AC-23]
MILALLPGAAFASGNKLLDHCNAAIDFMDNEPANPDFGALGYCFGMMQGVTNTNAMYEVQLGKDALFCAPEAGLNNGQAARIVVKYLKDNPKELHRHGTILAISAFMQAYPCE